MILDGLLLFDYDAAITAGGPSVNTLDLLNARDISIGYPIQVLVQPTQTFTAGGGATLQVQFQGSPDNSAWTTYVETLPITLANLTAGGSPLGRALGITVPRLPLGVSSLHRYLRLNYVVATGPMTAGRVTSGLLLDRQDNIAYPAGITINN